MNQEQIDAIIFLLKSIRVSLHWLCIVALIVLLKTCSK